MDYQTVQPSARHVWQLARRQHWVVGRGQLLGLGFAAHTIKHRVAKGRLHPTPWRGVYALGRPDLSRHGMWMAAVLACGEGAVLSHLSAAELWGIMRIVPWSPEAQHRLRSDTGQAFPVNVPVELAVPARRNPRRHLITVHRRSRLVQRDVTTRERIPVTTPVQTLIDLAPRLSPSKLERAINEADRLDLVDPEGLRAALDEHAGEPGVAVVRSLLDRLTFAYTDSELERRFLPLARDAGLPPPLTQRWVNGYRVDFYWPDLGLVVETDGLRYHRTAAQQTADRRRDQAHAAAGLTPLRFSHAQVEFDRAEVRATLRRVSGRLAGADAGGVRRAIAPARRRRAA